MNTVPLPPHFYALHLTIMSTNIIMHRLIHAHTHTHIIEYKPKIKEVYYSGCVQETILECYTDYHPSIGNTCMYHVSTSTMSTVICTASEVES